MYVPIELTETATDISLGGLRDFASAIISLEQTQSHRVCCLKLCMFHFQSIPVCRVACGCGVYCCAFHVTSTCSFLSCVFPVQFSTVFKALEEVRASLYVSHTCVYHASVHFSPFALLLGVKGWL